MGNSIKKNFGFNLLHTIVGFLFPIVTFPYVSRVLGVDGIGLIQFFQSILSYMALFSAIGIPLYAVKEVSKVRESFHTRGRVLVEILSLHLLFTLVGYLGVLFLLYYVPQVKEHSTIFVLLSTHLVFVAIGVEWFYQGIEDFKYVMIRSLFVKVVSIILLFSCVQTDGDLLIYSILLVAAEAGNNLFNFVRLRKYISCDMLRWSNLNIRQHIKPAMRIFVLNLVVSVYVNLDSVMLGFLCGESEVGYYSVAVRIVRTLSAFSAALGGVLLPRLAYCVANKNTREFRRLTQKALDFILIIIVPLTFGLIFTADDLVILLCGKEYLASVMTLKIISPLILFLGVSNLVGTRILYAQDHETIVIKSAVIGSILNFSLNMVLIPFYSHEGAAIASVIAEFFVTMFMLVLGRKYIPYSIINGSFFKSLIFSFVMIIPILLVRTLDLSLWIKLVLEIFVGTSVYFVLITLFSPRYLHEFLSIVKHR